MRQFSFALLILFPATFSLAVDETPAWNKLIRRLQTDRDRARTRIAALTLACDMADARGANLLMSTLAGWMDNIDEAAASGENIAQDSTLGPQREIIVAAVCQRGSRLNAVGDPATALWFWSQAATRTWIDQEAKEAAFQRIADNTSSLALRQASALAVLRDSGVGRSGRLPTPFIGLIDTSCTSQLRAMLRDSADPATFNFTAAAVLAERGDTAILPVLLSLEPLFSAVDARYGRALAWYSWQIQVQSPPEQLLTHIASPELYSPQSRRWALDKAVARNLPSARIRQAILDYAEAGRPFGRDRHAAGLATIKARGTQLGVLSTQDLPNVNTDGSSVATGTPQTRWNVSTPTVAWIPPWEPRYENIPVFFEWMRSQQWRGMSAEARIGLIQSQLRELELVQSPSSAPAPPP